MNVLYALRNCLVGDGEETGLTDDVKETLEGLKKDGVIDTDLIKIETIFNNRHIHALAGERWYFPIIPILMPYGKKILKEKLSLYRATCGQSFQIVEIPKDSDSDAVWEIYILNLFELYWDLEEIMEG